MEDGTESAKRIAAPKGRWRSPSQSDGLLGLNFLKGMQVDAMNALLCGAGHNLRKILARIRALLCVLSGDAKAAIQGLIAHVEGFSFYRPALEAARISL